MVVLDTAVAAAVGGLLLARVAYIGFHWNYYTDHLRQAVRLRAGGLAWQGALLGGTSGAAILGIVRGKRPLETLDVLTSGGASLAIFAWLGCFMTGCAHGIETFPGQGLLWTLSLDLPNLCGIYEPRVAVQLLGTGWSLLVFSAAFAAQRRAPRSGTAFGLWLALHSFGSLGLGFLRGDAMEHIAGWRVDQLANMALAVAGIGTLLLSVKMAGHALGESAENRGQG